MEAIELMHFQQHEPVQLCHMSATCVHMLNCVRSCVRSCVAESALQQGMQTVLVPVHNSKNAV